MRFRSLCLPVLAAMVAAASLAFAQPNPYNLINLLPAVSGEARIIAMNNRNEVVGYVRTESEIAGYPFRRASLPLRAVFV